MFCEIANPIWWKCHIMLDQCFKWSKSTTIQPDCFKTHSGIQLGKLIPVPWILYGKWNTSVTQQNCQLSTQSPFREDGGTLGMGVPVCSHNPPKEPIKKGIYPINTHYIRCIWGWFSKGPHHLVPMISRSQPKTLLSIRSAFGGFLKPLFGWLICFAQETLRRCLFFLLKSKGQETKIGRDANTYIFKCVSVNMYICAHHFHWNNWNNSWLLHWVCFNFLFEHSLMFSQNLGIQLGHMKIVKKITMFPVALFDVWREEIHPPINIYIYTI